MRRSLVLAIILVLACSSVCFAKVVKQYFPDGKLYSTQVYYDSGIIKGPYKIYWQNRRLREETLYQNGRAIVTHNWSESGVRLN
jgi:antitoxin component YwqK of YwqJK toxin-antitoxin module